MEALDQLETRVNELLARLDMLRMDNARLQTELAEISREKQNLADENHNLHASLAHAEGLRAEALRRVESLLLKIQEHESVG